MADERVTDTKAAPTSEGGASAEGDEQATQEHVPVDRELLLEVLDVVRPSLQADGGDCRLVDVDDDGVVSLELSGSCAGCPLSSITLGMGVERILKEHVPGVTKVISVTPGMSPEAGSALQSMLGYGVPAPRTEGPAKGSEDDDEEDIPTLL